MRPHGKTVAFTICPRADGNTLSVAISLCKDDIFRHWLAALRSFTHYLWIAVQRLTLPLLGVSHRVVNRPQEQCGCRWVGRYRFQRLAGQPTSRRHDDDFETDRYCDDHRNHTFHITSANPNRWLNHSRRTCTERGVAVISRCAGSGIHAGNDARDDAGDDGTTINPCRTQVGASG